MSGKNMLLWAVLAVCGMAAGVGMPGLVCECPDEDMGSAVEPVIVAAAEDLGLSHRGTLPGEK